MRIPDYGHGDWEVKYARNRNLPSVEKIGLDGEMCIRDSYNSYFYVVEDESLNVIDKFRLHGRRYIEHLTGGSALHLSLIHISATAQARSRATTVSTRRTGCWASHGIRAPDCGAAAA